MTRAFALASLGIGPIVWPRSPAPAPPVASLHVDDGFAAARVPPSSEVHPRLSDPGDESGRRDATGSLRPKTLAELERDLEAERPEKRRSAVRGLALLETRRAWNLVIGALQDAEPEVADEAQIALGMVRDPRLAAELLGSSGLRARDPAVRLRVAEALGRVPIALDGGVLAERCVLSDVETTRTILWSIERLHRAQRLGGDATKAVEEVLTLYRAAREPSVRAAALVTLGVLDYFAAETHVRAALADRDPIVRTAAVQATAVYTEAECVAIAERALSDPEPRVRCQALENLEALATRSALLVLAEHVAVELRERLRWRMLAFLQARSGLDHGFDADAWRAWAMTVSGRWETGERPRGPVGHTTCSFAGMTLVSDRVAFLIDFSGSMWQAKVGERTRKEIVDAHLASALRQLPEGTEFNLIPYASEPFPWEKSLIASTRANVARALAWFGAVHKSGRGNLYDALRLALSDPEVDTIVVLTDGVPTGGTRWNLELMVELLCQENRFRKVAFDAVLVDAPPGRKRHFEELARRTGGRVVSATFDDLAR